MCHLFIKCSQAVNKLLQRSTSWRRWHLGKKPALQVSVSDFNVWLQFLHARIYPVYGLTQVTSRQCMQFWLAETMTCSRSDVITWQNWPQLTSDDHGSKSLSHYSQLACKTPLSTVTDSLLSTIIYYMQCVNIQLMSKITLIITQLWNPNQLHSITFIH